MYRGIEPGASTHAPAAAHRADGARRLADRTSHALGRRRCRVRAAGALGCDAVRQGRHRRRRFSASPRAGMTYGHRFMAPKPIRLSSPGVYESALRGRGRVLADIHERRETVQQGVAAAASRVNGVAVIDAALLDEVTALVEWPVALAGRFAERFLALPAEVPIATMQDHQRYFPVTDGDGRLAAGIRRRRQHRQPRPGPGRRRQRARDPTATRGRRVLLAERSQGAAGCPHRRTAPGHVSSSSSGRCTTSPSVCVRWRPPSAARSAPTRAHVERAAQLAKCDLVTAMVGEFPELQGVMGRYSRAGGRRAARRLRGAARAVPAALCGRRVARDARRHGALDSRTGSTRWPASSRSVRSPRARVTRSACAGPRWASCASPSSAGSTSTCLR